MKRYYWGSLAIGLVVIIAGALREWLAAGIAFALYLLVMWAWKRAADRE